LLHRSEPARSHKESSDMPWTSAPSMRKSLMEKMLWLLLDDWFILVAAALRFLFPTRKTLAASSALCT
ncbi:hypothetical protein, partial [Salmonella sp. s57418]|uniref:hypothetical protein n=1 Tax=Salmonella sp. s57418 TaxID=3159696 RepID=UPI00397F9825